MTTDVPPRRQIPEAMTDAIKAEPAAYTMEPERRGKFRFFGEVVDNGIALYLTCEDVNRPETDYQFVAAMPAMYEAPYYESLKHREPTMVLSLNDLKGLAESLIDTIRVQDVSWLPDSLQAELDANVEETVALAADTVAVKAVAADRRETIAFLVQALVTQAKVEIVAEPEPETGEYNNDPDQPEQEG
jgi:hypothetical protein